MQTNEISAITQCVQAFFVFVGIYTEKSQQKAPALKEYGDIVQKNEERGRGRRNIL